MTDSAPTLRRDAERNRVRILTAAREVFATRGLGATLDDVAHHAGVGVGTVYRRFPNRDALVEELFEERLREIVALADAASEVDDPWDALTGFMERFLALSAADRGLKDVIHAGGRERVGAIREQMVPRVEQLLVRARDAGVLRADLVQTDFPIIGGVMLGAVIDVSRDIEPELWRRYLQIVLDGLRPARDAPTPLPVPAISVDQVDDVMQKV